MSAAAAKSKSNSADAVVASALSGADISKMLSSKSPTVKCVVLQHMRRDGKDTKPHPTAKAAHAVADHAAAVVAAVAGSDTASDEQQATTNGNNETNTTKPPRPVLSELIQEVSIDTTPTNKEIPALLGGPFTFVGQFPTEGLVVMCRRELGFTPEELAEQSIHGLRELCQDWEIDTSKMVEKSDLVQALLETAPELPINPHQLQPPLEGIVVRGDLLLIKVAETEEVLDQDDDDDKKKEEGGDDDDEKKPAGDDDAKKPEGGGGDEDAKAATGADEADSGERKQIEVLSNEEFFLDYTKEEYMAFAARTDIADLLPPPVADSDEDSDEDEDEEIDGDFQLDGDDLDEEEKGSVMNLILSEVIKQFREENGRGPNTEELLDLRSQVAEKLGLVVPGLEELSQTEQEKKRSAEAKPASPSPKRVKFSNKNVTALALAPEAASDKDAEGDEGAKKPPAKPDGNTDDDDGAAKLPAKTGEENGEKEGTEES